MLERASEYTEDVALVALGVGIAAGMYMVLKRGIGVAGQLHEANDKR
jgi:hypothetical protein